MNIDSKPILVIGGGIAGMTAAIEAAEVGYRVILVEKEAYLGGRVMRTYRYFPKMCPPACGFEINVRRIRQNRRITVHTLATVEEVSGKAGDFGVKVRLKPRYITGRHAISSEVIEQLSSERVDEFNLGMGKTKAVYLPHQMAYPPMAVLDRAALSEADAEKLVELCPPDAIDLGMTTEELDLEVGAIVLATGWRPYDATRLDNLMFGSAPNVITNVMMERLAATEGPTAGEIVRPSDGVKAQNVAFVQCAGSRDENHLAYCSAVCCMASLKQVRYLREKNPEARCTVFYIDIRTIGRLEKFYHDLVDDDNVVFIKGKVASISEVSSCRSLTLDVEDTLSGEILHPEFDLVVLATGMVPNTDNVKLPAGIEIDTHGFARPGDGIGGIVTAGCVKQPCDVSRATKDATGAALKAIQAVRGEG